MEARGVRIVVLLLVGAGLLGCDDHVGELPRAEPATSGDPRVPRGFDVPLPTGLTTRAGRTRDGRSVVLATSELGLEDTRSAVRGALESRGWSVRLDEETFVAEQDGRERARVRVAAGLSGLVRVEASEARQGRVDTEPEPESWRRVARAPLPAPPSGQTEPRCVEALASACATYAERADVDPLDCRMDHRGVCVYVDVLPYHARAVSDAETRLLDAMRCYDRVLSEAARAETAALVGLEWVAASAVARRAARAGAPVSAALEARLAAASPLAHLSFEAPEPFSTEDWWSEIDTPSDP